MSRRRATLCLALLTALALGLRQVGIDYGIPLWEEGDAHVHAHAELLRRGVESSRNRVDEIQYPSLLARLVAALPAPEPAPVGAPLEAHLAASRGTFLQTRRVVSLLAALVIPLTYLLARRGAGRGYALIAAAVPAVSLLHVNFSQEARPHAAVSTLFLSGVLACLALRRRPSAWRYLAAGVACALALGSLHSGAMTFASLAAAHWWAERPPGAPRRARWLEPRLVLAALPAVLAVPYFFSFAFDGTVRESKQVFRLEDGYVYMANHKLSLEMWNGTGVASVGRILFAWTPELLVLLPLAGLGFLARTRRADGARTSGGARRWAPGDLLVVLAFALPYLLLLALYARTYERFLLPILPYAAAFSATGLERLAERLSGAGRWPGRLPGALALVALGLALGASLHWTWLRTRPGTYELAGAWVAEHVDPGQVGGERVHLSPPYDLPLARRADALLDEDGKPRGRVASLWSRYQRQRLNRGEPLPEPHYDVRWLVASRADGDLGDPVAVEAYLDRQGPGVYVLEVARGARGSLAGERLREAVARRGRLAVRFGPDPDPFACDHPLADEDEEVEGWPAFFWRSLRAVATGPVVEVYRVP